MAKLVGLPVEKRLLDRQAADLIRKNILSGALTPGKRLLETQLAQELAVSRGTVRAALAQLAHERLVSQIAFTKWEVSGTSLQDAWELYALRSALEALAARLAACRATPADRARLSEAGAALAKAIREKRFEDVTDADFRVHEEIVAAAHHGRLADHHRFILQQVRVHMIHAGFLPRNYRELAEQHQALIGAVIQGNAEAAERLARTHNEGEVRALEEMMNAQSPALESVGS